MCRVLSRVDGQVTVLAILAGDKIYFIGLGLFFRSDQAQFVADVLEYIQDHAQRYTDAESYE